MPVVVSPAGRRLEVRRAMRRAERVRLALAGVPGHLLIDLSWEGVRARATALGIEPGRAYGRTRASKAPLGLVPYIGEIMVVGFTFTPVEWLDCDGQVLNIADYEYLFAMIGAAYGGDGEFTFALPDLQGRFPMHKGGSHYQTQLEGSEEVTMTTSQMPAHAHRIATTGAATTGTPASDTHPAAVDAASAGRYSTGLGTGDFGALQSAGGGQPHTNLPPYLGLRFAIATSGVIPLQ